MSNVSKLRFRGFSGEWNKEKFGELCGFEQGVQVDLELQHKEPNDNLVKFIRIENYTQNSNDFRFIPKELAKKKSIDSKEIAIVRYGATAGFIGRGVEGVLANNLFKLKPDKKLLDDKYLYHYLKSYKAFHFFQSEMSGGAMPALSFGIVKALKLPYPSTQEQEKIASFLSSVDSKIEQLSKKKTLLEQYKKGVMQKIFSQELRFKEDDGSEFPEWVEKKLGEIIVDYRLGGNYINTEVKSNHPLIKMGNLNRGKINISKLEYIKDGETVEEIDKIQYGDLFFNTRNTLDLVGKVAIWLNELPEAYYNSNLMYMKFENNFFMNYRLNSYDCIKALRSIATGTTSVAAIYTKDLLKIKLSIPSLKEQTKIATFLSSLDKKIELTEKELNATKEFKKALLQKMFV